MIQFKTATENNVKQLLEEMEVLSEEDAYRFGVGPEEILIRVFKDSIFVDSVFLDGRLIGVFGVLGEYLGSEGRPWSLLLPETEKYPFKLITFYRQALRKMLQFFPVLIDNIDEKHDKILRTLKIMGFTQESSKDGMIRMRLEWQVD